jgi:hypothetical protein
MHDNLENKANSIDESEKQYEKHNGPMVSTEAGIWIDRSPLPENANRSSRDNLESASIMMDSRDSQEKKHLSQMISTERGR